MRAAAGARCRAFTLIEMLVVLLIIGILALAAIPDRSAAVIQLQVTESLGLMKSLEPDIEAWFRTTGVFPADNLAAGLPEPGKLRGNYLVAARLENGALQLQFGNKAHARLAGHVVSLRPVFVPGSPASPVSWICGNDSAPAGMQAAGENRTDVPDLLLPMHCRTRQH